MNPGGFSSFGTGFGSTTSSLFSSNQNNTQKPTGLFGSTTNQSTLGSTTTQPQTSLFSSAFGGFQSTTSPSLGQPAQAQAGTVVKFAPPSGQDTINRNGSAQTINTNHQCITAMKEYESKSIEELRYEDYLANRKAPQTNAFGSTTGTSLFSSGATTTSTGFGSNLFGGSSTQTTANRPLLFGGTGTTTASTTSPQTTSLFGQTQASTAAKPGFFGSTTTPAATTTTGFSGFGTQPATQSVFGSQPQPAQQTTSIFGGLGQTSTTSGFGSTTGGGLFGSSTTPSTGGIFGQQQASKPLFSGGFGSTAAQPQQQQQSPFSFNTATTTAPATTTSLFGQSTTQSPLSAARPFGSTGFGTGLTSSTSTGFGAASTTAAPATGGLFGSNTQTAQKPAFGSLTSTGTTNGFGGFGTTTTTAAPAATSSIFGGFGTTAAQPAQQATASPFGSTLGGGLGGSTFGQTTTGQTGGLFGSTAATQPAAATTGGIFGTQQSGGFGSGLTSTGFGTTGQANQSLLGTSGLAGTSGTGGGLFGSTQTQPTSQFGLGMGTTGTSSFLGGNTGLTGGFGSGLTSGGTGQASGFGSGLNFSSNTLGTQQQQQQQLQMQQSAQTQAYQDQPLVQQQLMALSNSPYGNSYHLRAMQDASKKEDIFNPVSPIAQRPYITEAISPMKISSIVPSSISDMKGGLSQTIKITPKPLSTISINKKTDLFEGLEDEEVPCFYPRKNIKKLLFKPTNIDINQSRRSSQSNSVDGDHKIDFLRKSNYADEQPTLRFNPNTEYPASYSQAQLTTDSTNVSEDGHGAGDTNSENSNHPNSQHPAGIVLERPGYFTIPSMQELAAMTDAKGDCMVENFSIGRVDYGCITFPGMTNLANINLDEIVHIRRKEVHIYPDETKKPQVGQGLNKTAEITLHRIWPTDKETKRPVTDPMRVISMGYNKKIEKATVDMGAQFVDYDPTTGSWTFKVKHFSKYGLHDSDDDDDRPVAFHANNAAIKTMPNFIAPKENNHDLDAKQEKDMIQKQLKLIETRRLELMQHRKFANGSNLNTITNQQWDMLNEYVPSNNQVKPSFNDNSNVLHLELSEESHIQQTDDEEIDDKQSTISNEPMRKSLRKALILDNENETDDYDEPADEEEDKENSHLYPSLSKLKRSTLKLKSKKTTKKDKLYPSLNGFGNEQYKAGGDLFQREDADSQAMQEDEHMMSGMPFMVASTNDRLMAGTKVNKGLMKAFFGDEQETDEYMTMVEDDTKAKISGLIQKPQQFGLLKRGLGGLSNEEILESKMSFKKEPTVGQSKVTKITAMSLTAADVQQRIGTKALKPKLWSRFSMQKVMKLDVKKLGSNLMPEGVESDLAKLKLIKTNESTGGGEVLSFVKLENSIVNNLHNCVADAGLFHSRRFRVNFSLNPTACTFTHLNLNAKSTDMSVVSLMAPSMVTLGHALPQSEPVNMEAKISLIRENCEKYLQIQLELTDLGEENLLNTSMGSRRLQIFRPKPGNALIASCCELTQELRNRIGDHPDADNIEHMKSVWTLCQNLWGDIPDTYKLDPASSPFDPANAYETQQIKKRLLGEWLADVSGHRVERECKMSKFNKNKENHLNSIFSLLSANRLLDACKLAADCKDYRLALLLAQSSGGNEAVRSMVKKQIKEWIISGTDKYLNADRLKLYMLISGSLVLDSENQENQTINACENLDWKRQFGLHLWYNCLPINSIHDVLNSFEKSLNENLCNKPLPPYLEDSVSVPKLAFDKSKLYNPASSHQSFKSNISFFSQTPVAPVVKDTYDTCFHLIKLFCDEKYPIADIISPLNHNANQLDFRLSWHLAMALVSLNYKFISKECLENLHESYATQLQSFGLWHWAVFILMHIDDEKRRETLVKNYLSRYVTSDSELNEKEAFLIEKLSVPAEWVYDFKALRAKYEYLHENQFKLLLKAHKWNEAHAILIDLLAQDLFIKENLKTLYEYLVPLSKESQSINKWSLGGQIYMDFIRLNQKAQALFDFSNSNIEKKILNEDLLKETNDQIVSLSTRIKELKDLDCSTAKKLLVCVHISKMLLNFFNIFVELNSNDINQLYGGEGGDDEEEMSDNSDRNKTLTKQMVEKASKLTDSVPCHEIIQTMIMKKTKHTHNYLMSNRVY